MVIELEVQAQVHPILFKISITKIQYSDVPFLQDMKHSYAKWTIN